MVKMNIMQPTAKKQGKHMKVVCNPTVDDHDNNNNNNNNNKVAK